MKSLAEIFYDAIKADATLMEAIGNRVTSTCFETPPDEKDNTELPNIIVTNDGFQNNNSTKDYVWESPEDVVQATIDIAAVSDGDVERLVKMIRRAIENYIVAMYQNGETRPQLQPNSPTSSGIEWDWMKPCYYQKITYICTAPSDIDDEQENG